MLLLDTHIFLWWLADSRRLTKRLRTQIASTDQDVYVSAVSVWEIAIKVAIGKLELPGVDLARLNELIGACAFRELPITARHAASVSTLPMVHADPFDRLLIAQARAENAMLVSTDGVFARYEIPVLAR